MHSWDDPVSPNNNVLVNINSPPLQSTSGLVLILQFTPIPSSHVALTSPIAMEQRLFSLSNTVSTLAESINKGIEQNNLILAHQNGQANH